MDYYILIRYKNRNDEASIFASYLVGMEVVLRGVGASVFGNMVNIQQYLFSFRE